MPARHPGPVCAVDEPRDRTDPGYGFGWMVLQRHGRRPLAIVGRTLIHGDNRCRGLPWWSSVTIHETDTARFAVVLCHVAGEGPPWRDAWINDDAATLRAALDRHDPASALPWPVVQGMEGAGHAACRQFRAAWTGLLGALLGLAPSDRGKGQGMVPGR